MSARPDVPVQWIDLVDGFLLAMPRCRQEDAWVGVRWRVGQATVAHLFGGEDGRFRLMFRADPGEVEEFEHLGEPYFRAQWGGNVVGVVLDESTDWQEIRELLIDSYCVQAPPTLAAQVQRPG